MRDQRVGVGAAHRVEDLVHRGAQQVQLVDEDHQRGLAVVDRAVVGKLARQPQVATNRLGQIIRSGGHDVVGLKAARAQVRQSRDGVAHGPGDPRDPGDNRRGDRTAGHHRLDTVECGEQVVAGGNPWQLGAFGLATATRHPGEELTQLHVSILSQTLSVIVSDRQRPVPTVLPRSSAPRVTCGFWRSTRSRYSRDLLTSVSRVPIVADMLSSACTLNESIASMVA